MAKILLVKLQIKTNFSFSKLHNQLDSILNDVVDDAKRLYRASTQENLKSGKLRKLRPASIEARKKGHYWGGKKVSPTSSTKPLMYTGRLYNSIKWHDDGIEMVEYGLRHQEGFGIPMKRAGITFNQTVPPRPFLALNPQGKRFKGTKYGKSYAKFQSKMYKKIHKALKK